MVEIFSAHQAEVAALRREIHMSRLAMTQAGLAPDTLLDTDCSVDPGLDGRSGVESTASEVRWSTSRTGPPPPLQCLVLNPTTNNV